MTLPQAGSASGPDVAGYYYQRYDRGGAPCRDVSWHPHFPVLASTSFDQSVKIWTIQNQQSEKQDLRTSHMQKKKQSDSKSAKDSKTGYESEYGDESDDVADFQNQKKAAQINSDSGKSEENQDDDDDSDQDERMGAHGHITIQQLFRLLM